MVLFSFFITSFIVFFARIFQIDNVFLVYKMLIINDLVEDVI